MTIEPISEKNIEAACELANPIFPDEGLSPEESFWASLHPGNFRLIYTVYDLTALRYWVAFERQEAVGTVGLYKLSQDEKVASWLGWFCVKESWRRNKIGTALLDFAMKEARMVGDRMLKLYTGADSKSAISFYKNQRFTVAGHGKDVGGKLSFYYEKNL